MEIIIGSIPPLAAKSQRPQQQNSTQVEAQLLHVRRSRTGIAGPSGMERRVKKVKDPVKGKVLTLMVPDAAMLPADLESAKYDVYVRFVRR